MFRFPSWEEVALMEERGREREVLNVRKRDHFEKLGTYTHIHTTTTTNSTYKTTPRIRVSTKNIIPTFN